MDSLLITVKITSSGAQINDTAIQTSLCKELNDKLGSSFSSKSLSLKYDQNNKCYNIVIFLKQNVISDYLYSDIISHIKMVCLTTNAVEILYIDRHKFNDYSIYYLFLKYWLPILLIFILVGSCIIAKSCESKPSTYNKITVTHTLNDSINQSKQPK